jgi:DNA-binding transcriptional ArsR family regulator
MNKITRASKRFIDNPKAAAFFVDVVNIKHLEPFMAGEASLSEAAQKLKLGKSRMSYWVKKLLELNLIYTVRVEKHGRHRVAIYRSSADIFIIPIELVTHQPDEDVFRFDTFEGAVKRSLVHFAHNNFKGWHIRYALEQGTSTLHVLPQSSMKDIDVTNYWGQIKLNKTQATALHQEMKKLFEKFTAEAQNNKGKDHVFKLVLVEQWPQ